MSGRQVSQKCLRVLALLGEGKTIHQITESNPDISRVDVAIAAREAQEKLNELTDAPTRESVDTSSTTGPKYNVTAIRTDFPSAYAPWTDADDHELAYQFGEKRAITELAKYFQRKPSAIRARLKKLELL